MFVVPTDFDGGLYNLPNLDKVPNTFADFINTSEKEALQKLLGTTFYNALIAGTSALPAGWVAATDYAVDTETVVGLDIYKSLQTPNTNKPPLANPDYWQVQPANRWLHLKIGEMYKVDGADEEWVGLKTMLIPFIHASWLRDSIDTSVQATGVVQAKSENSVIANSGIRYGKSMTNFYRIAGKYKKCEVNTFYRYLYINSETFDDLVIDVTTVSNFADYLKKYFKSSGIVDLFNF